MPDQPKALEEIRAALKTLREKPGSCRRFPKQLWGLILELAKTHPHQEICRQLEIHPAYLKRKIRKSQNLPESPNFQEVFYGPKEAYLADNIVIDLVSKSGVKVKIRGHASCLSYLSSLFKGY